MSEKQLKNMTSNVNNLQKKTISSIIPMLKHCAKKKHLNEGSKIHANILRNGLLERSPHIGSSLVSMYAKCGDFKKSQEVFDELQFKGNNNISSWNALIGGYILHGKEEEALVCFHQMKYNEGIPPDSITFSCILKACANTRDIFKGREIHDEIVKLDLVKKDVVLATALVDMYAKCGQINKAEEVFFEIRVRNIVSWNALITGYAQHGLVEKAWGCVLHMQREGISPDAITFACILKACGNTSAIEEGEKIHNEIVHRGFLREDIIMLGNALVAMYVKCDALGKAEKVLKKLQSRNVVTWSTIIAGYAHKGMYEESLSCFERMQNEGFSPNVVTFICILKACGNRRAIAKGEKIHHEIVRKGKLNLENDVVLGTALVDMYAKCGSLEKAREVLEELAFRDVIAWNTLITGYVQSGQGIEALESFKQMQEEGLSPDNVTFGCILKACGSIGAIEKGERIHDEIVRRGLLGKDIVLGNALVDMYAKCGALEKAQEVVDKLLVRDIVSWNSLITAYAQQGRSEEVLNCFKHMQDDKIFPDSMTFLCLLNACSHAGLLDDGERYFLDVSKSYNTVLHLDYYTCMVDLFCRAGHFEKALMVIKNLPLSDCIHVWNALLSACKNWGNVKLGRLAFEQAIQLDNNNLASYVLMVNIYIAAGMKEDAKRIETMREHCCFPESRTWI